MMKLWEEVEKENKEKRRGRRGQDSKQHNESVGEVDNTRKYDTR